MSKERYFNILDFGSSKLRFSVFDDKFKEKYSDTCAIQLDNNQEILDSFTDLLKKAEKKISSHIEDIILILDSKDLLTIDLSFRKNLDNKTKFKKVYDTLILELKQTIQFNYPDYQIIHIIFDKCIIDDKIYLEIPNNQYEIKNIKVDFKLICFPHKLTKNLTKIFNKININIQNFFCSSYVKTLFYLKNLNYEKISFLDIGLEKTCFIAYEKKKLKIIQTIPVGGKHITNDISKIFNITFDDAEKIKRLFNKSETEFNYKKKEDNKKNISVSEILSKKISIDLLKEVILYRVQEIIDLNFKKKNLNGFDFNLDNSELFLIGEGSILFDNNSFYLKDKFKFNSLNFYGEIDKQICHSGLVYYLNNKESSKKNSKKYGLFERFFNYFSK